MKNAILIILMLFLCSSCDEFLTEDPRGNLSADQYFNTKEECTSAINGLYFRFSDSFLHSSLIHTLNIGTDQFFTPRAVMFGGMVHGIYEGLGVFDVRILDYWTVLYRGVRDANLVISRIEQSPLDESEKAALLGEAKFIRAMFYYYLATLWGDVPFWTDELNIDEVSLIGKTAQSEIFDYILNDLETAESTLPSTTWGQNSGRATKWAAKMLKARIYLWIEDWGNAKTEASEIIAQSPHILMPNYGDIFKSSKERNAELIFGIEFKEDAKSTDVPNQYRPQGNLEAHIKPAPVWFNGIAAWCLYRSFIDTFEPNDIRKKYIVVDSIDGKKTNYYYCLKYMEVPLPISDPLMDVGSPMAKLNSGMDNIYMRLGDTYLVLAESENELNGPTEIAYDAVNAIRNRAKLADLPEDLDQEGLRQAIRGEISKELVGEAIGRKMDLIRWGILEETVKGLPAREVIAQQNPLVSNVYKTRATFYATSCATKFSGKWNFFPIPGGEVQRNPNLEQNPLWE
ncbi:MAG: RagB/SusD family nutrient uptake outer membrane protein [Bacteroidales bacterium]|nr:RagB/SusD family nutrient uptake outer membrane protein [Bacteroidales bacterium]